MFPAPQPPRDLMMPAGLQDGLLALFGSGAVVAVAVLVGTAIHRRDWVPALLLLGTLLCAVYEPIGDMLVLAYYPERGQVTWVTLFGRSIPVFIGLMYVCYIGAFMLLWEHLRRRGFTRWSWWSLWAGTAGAIIVIEIVVLRIDQAWVYYGPQRMIVAGLPVWTPITYVSFLFTIAAGVHGLRSSLRPRHHWLIIPAVPALLAAAHVTTALPAAAALYSTDSPTIILLGALGSVAASAVLAYALSLFLVNRRPSTAPEPPAR